MSFLFPGSAGLANCCWCFSWVLAGRGPSGRPGPGAAAAGVFPNPLAAGQTQVRLEATLAAAESVRVQVLNAMGVPVATATLRYPAGTSSQPLAVGSLAAGPYVVRFVSGSLAGTALTLLKKE